MRFISLTAISAAMLLFSAVHVHALENMIDGGEKDIRNILRIHESGMFSRSRHDFSRAAAVSASSDPEGYAVLDDVIMKVPGYEAVMSDFLVRNPQSVLATQIRWHHALNLFDAYDYAGPDASCRRSMLRTCTRDSVEVTFSARHTAILKEVRWMRLLMVSRRLKMPLRVISQCLPAML